MLECTDKHRCVRLWREIWSAQRILKSNPPEASVLISLHFLACTFLSLTVYCSSLTCPSNLFSWHNKEDVLSDMRRFYPMFTHIFTDIDFHGRNLTVYFALQILFNFHNSSKYSTDSIPALRHAGLMEF